MKNILIVGPPRSGKTTLSKIIFNQYNVYSIINMDVIRDGIYEAFFCDIEKSTRKEIVTNAVPKFIKKIIEHYQKYYNPDMYYIIEGDILSIEDAIEIRNQYEVDIIYVGMPNIKEIDLFNRIRENASKYGCWTSKCSDIELHKRYYDIIEQSKKDKIVADENEIVYLDTSLNNDCLYNYVKR